MSTFSDRVRSRWVASIVLGACGFMVAQVLVWVLMLFVVFVAVQLEDASSRRLIIVVVEILVGLVYLWAWAIRGMQLVNIDVILRDAGPIEREIIGARISQETKAGKA